MGLQSLQAWVLEFITNPILSERFETNQLIPGGISLEDMSILRGLDFEAIRNYQVAVQRKWLSTISSFSITERALGRKKFMSFVMKYIYENPMTRNEWSSRSVDFLEFIVQSDPMNPMIDYVKYELYVNMLTLGESPINDKKARGFNLDENSIIDKLYVSSEFIEDTRNIGNTERTTYALVFRMKEYKVEIFEIDEAIYCFLVGLRAGVELSDTELGPEIIAELLKLGLIKRDGEDKSA